MEMKHKKRLITDWNKEIPSDAPLYIVQMISHFEKNQRILEDEIFSLLELIEQYKNELPTSKVGVYKIGATKKEGAKE